jgi:hypothetical protein
MEAGRMVAFTGTRQGMTPEQRCAVEELLVPEMTDVIHGGCEGADRDFHEMAQALDLRIHVHPSNVTSSYPKRVCELMGPPRRWPLHKAWLGLGAFAVRTAADPLERNKVMLSALALSIGPSLLIACPAQAHEIIRSGTWYTIRRARKRAQALVIVRPDGTMES